MQSILTTTAFAVRSVASAASDFFIAIERIHTSTLACTRVGRADGKVVFGHATLAVFTLTAFRDFNFFVFTGQLARTASI